MKAFQINENEILSNYVKDQTGSPQEFLQTTAKKVSEILSNYFKNRTKGVPKILSNYFEKNKRDFRDSF